MSKTDTQQTSQWTEREKSIFHFVFIFFTLMSLPISVDLFKNIFDINWLHVDYGDIFNLTRLSAKFIPGPDSFISWLIVGVVAFIGALAWSKSKYSNANYNELYYWVRVIVRYRLAIGVIGYGIIKVFPLQSPFPSISNMNTAYGDFTDWKIFSMSLGIVPGYEAFLGGIEVLAGLLLLFRKTATIGAAIILVFTGNVLVSNLAYNGGEYVYAFYLIVLALFVFWFDAFRIYNLLSLERPTQPNKFKPAFAGRLGLLRITIKVLVLFFFVFLYGFKARTGVKQGGYQFPRSTGLAKAAGIYNVSVFKVNNNELPYSATDPERWRDVVFEKWATISVRSNRPVIIDSTNYEQIANADRDRNYELAGSAGRHYYSYTVDSINQVISLENKNHHYRGEKMVFKYVRTDTSTITLSGVDHKRDSIYVVLSKVDKKYPVQLNRRKSLKL